MGSAQHTGQVCRSGGSHPRLNQVANRPFVVGHRSLEAAVYRALPDFTAERGIEYALRRTAFGESGEPIVNRIAGNDFRLDEHVELGADEGRDFLPTVD